MDGAGIEPGATEGEQLQAMTHDFEARSGRFSGILLTQVGIRGWGRRGVGGDLGGAGRPAPASSSSTTRRKIGVELDRARRAQLDRPEGGMPRIPSRAKLTREFQLECAAGSKSPDEIEPLPLIRHGVRFQPECPSTRAEERGRWSVGRRGHPPRDVR